MNIDIFLPKALVLHNYRVRGVEKILEINGIQKIRSICWVNPIMIKNVMKEKQTIKDAKILAGFLVSVDIISNKYNQLFPMKNFKNNIYELRNHSLI